MNVDDRLALELGRALLRAVSAEARAAQALVRVAELEAAAPPSKAKAKK